MLRIVTIKTTSEIDQFFITLYMCRHKDRIRKMAYLTFAGSEDKQNTCFKFIGADNKTPSTSVLVDKSSEAPISLLSSNDCGEDTCSFYQGPSDSTIFAFGESTETSGAVALGTGNTETSSSVAFSGGCESVGSVATSVSTSSSSSSSSFTCIS